MHAYEFEYRVNKARREKHKPEDLCSLEEDERKGSWRNDGEIKREKERERVKGSVKNIVEERGEK